MKYWVSLALLVLLLGMPVGCILAGSSPAHPCCPRKSMSLKCPYDALDNAKITSTAPVASVPMAMVSVVLPNPPVMRDLLPEVAEAQPDLLVLNRILRI